MSFTGDYNDPIDRIRLILGDTNEFDEGLSDDIYQAILDANDGNENKATYEALKYLVAKYASLVTEKTGDVFVKASEKYEHYKSLLDGVGKPGSIINSGNSIGGFTGGISRSQNCANKSNPDNVGSPIRLGETYSGYIPYVRKSKFRKF